MHGFAQTHLQLFQQILRNDWTRADRVLIRDAYQRQLQLYSGRQTESGKPHIIHNVGTASILASLSVSPALVAVGLNHNAYGSGDFGDGIRGATSSHRAEMRELLGDHAEACLARFMSLGWAEMSEMVDAMDARDEVDRDAVLLRLADDLEHHLDLGYLFRVDDAKQEAARGLRELKLALARALGQPSLAEAFEQAFAAMDAFSVPDDLRCPVKGEHHVVSRSFFRVPFQTRAPILTRLLYRLRQAIRERRSRRI